MLCLCIRLFAPFRRTSVPSCGGVRSVEFSRTGDSFHNLQRHIIPILYNAVKGVLRCAGINPCNLCTCEIKPPYRANRKATKSKQARTAASQVRIKYFNLLKFFINFSGQIRTKSGAKIKILCNRFLDFKIAYDGGFKNFTLYFVGKFFQFFK